jgi:hypothetical protein
MGKDGFEVHGIVTHFYYRIISYNNSFNTIRYIKIDSKNSKKGGLRSKRTAAAFACFLANSSREMVK